ncbi:MAG: glycosyl hydrolase 115 family protein [Rikenellaceae bacterium]
MTNLKLGRILLFLFVILGNIYCGYASSGFTLFDGDKVSQIYIAPNEPTPLKIAAEHLRDDIEMVTGVAPQIVADIDQLKGDVVILSTNENNSLIDGTELVGLYDSYILRSVKSPINGVDKAMIVVGSDALGAVYGAYNISEMIGVSPLYWWCDIEPKRLSKVVLEDCDIAPHQPSVRYRGIFINDEEALIQWSRLTSKDKTTGAISAESYKRIFELMLRLKANMLWPSMMEAGSFFFEYRDGDGVAINPRTASDYGLYIGASHCEQMGRNNYAEWYDWAAEHEELFAEDDRHYEFDYTVNPTAIESYWGERLRECRDFNMIFTIGIRGVHDTPFMCRKLENPTLENRVKLLQGVIDLQRGMIKEIYGAEDAVPQIFVPYEETAELYNGESTSGEEKCKGLDLPQDVMVIPTEDNYGYLRQLPAERELSREGGTGIYYHLAYQGFPSPYDWLTTMPYKLMQQELSKLYEIGANKFWIVNVGDIKPAEMGIRYFMDLAYDSDKYFKMTPREYLAGRAQELFEMEEDQAVDLANLYSDFCLTANRHKPEFMTSFWSVDYESPSVYGVKDIYSYFSTVDFGDEAERAIEEYNSLEARAKAIYDNMAERNQMAFYHLIYYPMRSARLMAEKSYYFHKNKIYAEQGRFSSVNGYRNRSLQASREIDEDLNYYRHELAGGKWNGIMDPYGEYNLTERVLDIAGIPKDFVYQERFTEQAIEELGSVCEGQLKGDEDISLIFSSLEDNRRFVDLFSRGLNAQSWSLKSSSAWINFSDTSGEVQVEDRVWVTIDWNKTQPGENHGVIEVSGADGVVKSYDVVANNITERIKPKSYVEGAGFVVIEAENYTNQRMGTDGSKWVEVDDMGYNGATMRAMGKRKAQSALSGAVLEYQIYFTSAGEFDALLYRIPTLNEGKGKSCEVAVGLDGSKPWVLKGVQRKSQTLVTTMEDGTEELRNWHRNVIAQMEKIPFKVTVDSPGYHTLKLYQMDRNIAIDRIVIATTPQSMVAQKRSVVGAPQSYNTIVKSYESERYQSVAELTPEDTAITPYPTLEPLIYAKFIFSKQGNPPVWGFTPVSPYNVFDKNTTLFGWDPANAKDVYYKHNENTRVVPHFRRDLNTSNYPASFYVQLLEGDYEVILHAGEVMNYSNGRKGEEYKMTVHANGKELMRERVIESDEFFMERFNVKVGRDNLLKFDFSDHWAISVIEIYRK